MRLGIGLGLFKQAAVSVGVRLFSAYKSRVIADGGTVEADNCAINALNNGLFQRASLLLIPSGYKGGKAYAEIPTNGNGDLTWVRGSSANRTNSSGNIELMASGVPRLSYMYGSCPALLLEPQRTNLVFPSNTASTQTRTVTAVAHTLSFFGMGTVVLSGAAIATLNGTGANNRVSLTFTPTAGSLILTVTGTVTNWQLEVGSYASTVVTTTTAAATRVADSFSRDNIFTNGLITSSGGTWFLELRGNLVYTRDATGNFWLGDNATSGSGGTVNSFTFRNNGGGSVRLAINKVIGGTLTALYTTTTDTTKIAIKWNGSTADVFANGTKVVSATSFTATNMEFLNGLAADVPKFIQAMGLWSTPQTDQFCQDITTL